MIRKGIAQYQIVEKLGEGGMGVVYRAEDTVLRREVALKLLRVGMGGETELRMRLLREARMAAALSHPNICTIYEVGEVGAEDRELAEAGAATIRPGTPFIAMELARGRTLQACLSDSGVLPLKDLASIAVQIAEGLAAAHAEHIVHRDLKPSNVMVDANGRVKILDFGLAKPLKFQPDDVSSFAETRSAERSREGTVVGTVAYMSPEQTLGKSVDSRSDVFAFGILLYEMAAGVRPFQGETATSTIAKILEAEPRPLGTLREGSPPDLERIVRRCLEKNPNDRFNDTRDLVAELKALQKAFTPGQTALSSAGIRVERPSRKLAIAAWSIAALILAAVSAFVAVKFSSRSAPPFPIAAVHRQITFIGDVSNPAISPDGQSVAFVAGNLPKQKLMVQDVGGGQAIQVYEGQNLQRIRWSPDGSKLLFFAYPGGGLVVPRLGGEARSIAGGAFVHSWAGDGTWVVGLLQPRDRFAVVNIATGETKLVPIKKDFTFYNDVDWSPRRDLLLISTLDEAEHTVFWTIRPDGSQQQKILESDTPLSSPRWSSTEDVLYYFRGQRSKELWKLALTPSGARQGDPVLVMPAVQAGGFFALSRDGKRLAYANAVFHSNLHRVDLGPGGSSKTSPLTEGTLIHETPSISPDGTQIAFARGDGQALNIFTMPIEGGTAKQLTFFNSVNIGPVWSPDGQRIAFGSMEGGVPRVSIINATGGLARRFTRSLLSGNTMELVWSPFSRVAYQRPGNRNFYLLDPATEEEAPLVRDSMAGWMFQPRYSPRGDQVLAYWNRQPSAGLWLISFKNFPEGEVTQLARAPTAAIAGLASQAMSAAAYRGKEIRVRGFLKSLGDRASRAQCYLRIDRANEQNGQSINHKQNQPVRSPQWTPCEITAKIDDDAVTINFGAIAYGLGKFWVDEFEVHFKDSGGTWQPVEIVNPSFEETDQTNYPRAWSRAGGRHRIAADPYKGRKSLMLENTPVVNRNLYPLGWSPDGTQVYAVDSETRTIVTIPATGGEENTVFAPSWSKDLSIAGVSMSPDARHLVYSLSEGKSDIWIVDNFDPGVR